MQRRLAKAPFAVERDGRRIHKIGLNHDDMGAEIRGDGLQMLDQARRNLLATRLGVDREIVDVDLAALLLELLQLIGDEAADDGAPTAPRSRATSAIASQRPSSPSR